MSEQNIIVASDLLTAEISPLGAEMQQLIDHAGNDLQWSGDPAVWSGRAPILFPVVGMLQHGRYSYDGTTYEMPKHGFARHSKFAVVAQAAGAATFRLGATPQTRAIYPFEFRLDIAFGVVGGTLSLRATIANLGDTDMPASFGFHPAFRWPLPYGRPRQDHRLRFAKPEAAPIRRIDANGFLIAEPCPTPVVGDTLPLRDDLFVADALIFERLVSNSVRYGATDGPVIEIGYADFPTLGVWTKPGADFICIEGWHGFSDPQGFTGDIWQKPGIFGVAAGGARTMSMTIALLAGR